MQSSSSASLFQSKTKWPFVKFMSPRLSFVSTLFRDSEEQNYRKRNLEMAMGESACIFFANQYYINRIGPLLMEKLSRGCEAARLSMIASPVSPKGGLASSHFTKKRLASKMAFIFISISASRVAFMQKNHGLFS